MAFANLGHAIPQLKLEESAEDSLFKSISMRSLQQLQQQLRIKPCSPISFRKNHSRAPVWLKKTRGGDHRIGS
ncbi:hypothetical protein COCON_G00185070, partial [Conger conger]